MTNKGEKHKDLPRDEIVQMAEEIIAKSNGKAQVYFKFTCQHCGQRCTLSDANTLHEKGECFQCGLETVIIEAGFMLVLTMNSKGGDA